MLSGLAILPLFFQLLPIPLPSGLSLLKLTSQPWTLPQISLLKYLKIDYQMSIKCPPMLFSPPSLSLRRTAEFNLIHNILISTIDSPELLTFVNFLGPSHPTCYFTCWFPDFQLRNNLSSSTSPLYLTPSLIILILLHFPLKLKSYVFFVIYLTYLPRNQLSPKFTYFF
jgi:hypothetical protein